MGVADGLLPRQPDRGCCEHRVLALVELGVGQAPGDRHPGRGADQVQPQPQKNRLWLAQQPYPAFPARSERRAAGRERAHSTGVESER
jgi:hypothetical protein